MTRNVDDANLIFKLSLDTQQFNQALVKVPYQKELHDLTFDKKMKFGVLMGIDWIHGLCPTIIRAQKETAEILWRKGHEVVEVWIRWLEEAC